MFAHFVFTPTKLLKKTVNQFTIIYLSNIHKVLRVIGKGGKYNCLEVVYGKYLRQIDPLKQWIWTRASRKAKAVVGVVDPAEVPGVGVVAAVEVGERKLPE